jgi:hypothetical protein
MTYALAELAEPCPLWAYLPSSVQQPLQVVIERDELAIWGPY